ncbi:AbrB/MazE/SpoVT family DNA-binding domain-containing protein, partial [bacterium]|nr:AbrB/MazE/SpoVT family DNA-binding domain-containing protein [bacterium]
MERRKLIKQGKGGYTIYLPKKWIDKKGLKEGDEIKLEEKDNMLMINCDKKEILSITINIDKNNLVNIRHLMNFSYRNAYDIIIIKNCPKEKITELIEMASKLLLGFEMISNENQNLIFENISEPTENKYETLMRRIFIIIKESIKIIKENYSKEKYEESEKMY